MKTLLECESFDGDYPVTADEVLTALRNCYPAAKFVVRELPEKEQSNTRYLLGAIDCIHSALCPGRSGTWQMRVEQAVAAAERKGCELPAQPEKGQSEKFACIVCGKNDCFVTETMCPECRIKAEMIKKQPISGKVEFVFCCGKQHEIIQWTYKGPLQYGAECSVCGKRLADESPGALKAAWGKVEDNCGKQIS